MDHILYVLTYNHGELCHIYFNHKIHQNKKYQKQDFKWEQKTIKAQIH